MKILSIQYGNINNPYTKGGLPSNLHHTYRYFSRDHSIECWTGEYRRQKRSMELDNILYIKKSYGHNKYLDRLTFSICNAFYKIENYDIAVLVWDRYAPIVRFSNARIPVVIEIRNDYFSATTKSQIVEPVSDYLLKKALQKNRYFIYVSHHVRHISKPFIQPSSLSAIIPPGISPHLLKDDRVEEDDHFILFLGRLDYKDKGLDLLLKAYLKANISLNLIIAGDGPDRLSAERFVRDNRMTERVLFTGWIGETQKNDLLRLCTFVCMPSRNEGWGTVSVEAAAFGKPVIAMKIPPLEEAVIDKHTGILFDKEDIGGFAEALKALSVNNSLRRRLGKNAAERSRNLSFDKLAEKKESFLKEVIDDFKSHKSPVR